MIFSQILKEIFNLEIGIQNNILKYIPDVRTIFLIELKNINKIKIKTMEKQLLIKRKYNEIYLENIYISCPHIEYTKERWNDYHHNYTRKRCDLCKLELRQEDGIIETKFINCDY
jgi:hypothetical protein